MSTSGTPDSSADRVRDTRGKFANNPDVAERDAAAMRLRAKGLTYERIAQQLGYNDRAHAKLSIERAYDRVMKPSAHALREQMDDQLDQLTERIMKVMDADHLKVSAGSTVFDPTSGDLMRDDAPILAAADRIMKVIERRAKLYGLDAPTKVEAQVQSVRVTVDGAEDV